MMRIPTRARERGLRFNITPLIDVVFLLIIFFLAAAHFARSETQEPVELPEAVEAEDDTAEQPRRLVITVDAKGGLYVAGKAVELATVESLVAAGHAEAPAQFEVRIRADEQTPYRAVEPILMVCVRAGVTRIKWAVLPKN